MWREVECVADRFKLPHLNVQRYSWVRRCRRAHNATQTLPFDEIKFLR
jgi:hypothetical protein